MQDIFLTYIEPILTFILGGGLVSLIKWRSVKKQAEADAMKSVQEVYQIAIKDLREDKDMMKKENAELREMILELQKIVHQNTLDIQRLQEYKCIVKGCHQREID